MWRPWQLTLRPNETNNLSKLPPLNSLQYPSAKILHDLAYPNGEPNKQPIPIGTIPTALAEYLTIVAGITAKNMAPILATIATTDAAAHQFLNQTKLAAISDFRSNKGIPSPSPSTGAFSPVDLCSHCQKATSTRWFSGHPNDDEDILTAPLLQQCYTHYINNSQKRLDPARGHLVEQYTLPYLKQHFQDQGAYVCWPCASPVLCARLLSSKLRTITTEKITPHTSLNLNDPTDCAPFLRHIFLASSHPLRDILKQLHTRSVIHLASLTREQHPCGLHNHPAIKIDNSWWVPYISTPPPFDPECVVPGHTPGQWVIWMYSVQSESHAAKTKLPKGTLTQTNEPTYNLSRFRAFLKSDVENAIENTPQANSLLASTSSTSVSMVDPLIIPIALTPTNALLAYSLTRETVYKLRSAQAWKYDDTKEPKVTLNMAYDRTIFHNRITVERLILPLHPDTRTSTPTTDPNYKMAFNFLTEIALSAFTPNKKGEYLDTLPAICHDDYCGNLKPKTSNKKAPMNTPPGQTTFSWPDMNPKKRKFPQDEPNQQPGPANSTANPEQSKRRPNTPHPWEYCNNCWEFGKHYSDSCMEPPAHCSPDLKTIQKNEKRIHQETYNQFQNQKKKKTDRYGDDGKTGAGAK